MSPGRRHRLLPSHRERQLRRHRQLDGRRPAIKSYTFPTAASFGSGWSRSGSGATRTYSWTPGAATPGAQTVTATNNAGRTANANFAVEVSDITPPTTTIQCNGAACQATYYTSAPVSVTLSADDGPTGSGVDVIRYTLDGSDPTPLNGWTTSARSTSPARRRSSSALTTTWNEEAVGSKQARRRLAADALAYPGRESRLGRARGPGRRWYSPPGSGRRNVPRHRDARRPADRDRLRRLPVSRERHGWQPPDIVAVPRGLHVGLVDDRLRLARRRRDQRRWCNHARVVRADAGLRRADRPDDHPDRFRRAVTWATVSFSTGDGSDGGSGLDTSTRTVTRETGTLSGDSCSGFSPDGGTFSSPDTTVTGGHCYRRRRRSPTASATSRRP